MNSYFKTAVVLALVSGVATAKSVTSTQACEAFNNLKHSKNYGHVVLKEGHSYPVLQERKGSYFIRVPGANPVNRWVSSSCFNNASVGSSVVEPMQQELQEPKNESTKSVESNLDSVLVLSWHNAFCEKHMNKKECKRDGSDAKNRLVLHGLWPQPRNNVYCSVNSTIKELDKQHRWGALPKLNLDNKVLALMQEYMPGYQSKLQRHEWVKHGTCYTNDPIRYFKDALTMTKKLDATVGEYLRANIGKSVKLFNIKRVAARLIDKDIANKIAMKCKGPLLSEIWISLKGQGSDISKLIKNAKTIRSNCQEAIVDAPGKFRR
ncbi:MAG TPA: hypothetical protein ENL00_03035 [Nitratifractor sp.]|nr:hypothetical protein [Nitratifractor sp.]